MPPKKHVFVCVQNRPAGHPRGSCQSLGSPRVYQAFVDEFNRRSLWGTIRLTTSGCLGPCECGANVVIYPEGILYGRVSQNDVIPIIEEHLVNGTPIERLRIANW